MRSMRQKVLPAPGPARTSVAPGRPSMASRWEGEATCGGTANGSGARAISETATAPNLTARRRAGRRGENQDRNSGGEPTLSLSLGFVERTSRRYRARPLASGGWTRAPALEPAGTWAPCLSDVSVPRPPGLSARRPPAPSARALRHPTLGGTVLVSTTREQPAAWAHPAEKDTPRLLAGARRDCAARGQVPMPARDRAAGHASVRCREARALGGGGVRA